MVVALIMVVIDTGHGFGFQKVSFTSDIILPSVACELREKLYNLSSLFTPQIVFILIFFFI